MKSKSPIESKSYRARLDDDLIFSLKSILSIMKTMFNYFENKTEVSSFLGNNFSYIDIILVCYKVTFPCLYK